jgi:hypothetical protein
LFNQTKNSEREAALPVGAFAGAGATYDCGRGTVKLASVTAEDGMTGNGWGAMFALNGCKVRNMCESDSECVTRRGRVRGKDERKERICFGL